MITIIAYAATVGVLGSYALSITRHDPNIFAWGNAVGFIPLVTANLMVGAYWGAIISLTFGIIAVGSLVSTALKR